MADNQQSVFQNVPQQLLELYADLIRKSSEDPEAHAHLLNFLLDVDAAAEAVARVIEQARQRANS